MLDPLIALALAVAALVGLRRSLVIPGPERCPRPAEEVAVVLGCPGLPCLGLLAGQTIALRAAFAPLAAWLALMVWWTWRVRGKADESGEDEERRPPRGGDDPPPWDPPPGDPAERFDWDAFERGFRAEVDRRERRPAAGNPLVRR